MRLLLDSHAALWALISPARLGREAALAIMDGENALFMSPAVAMELTTKYRIGKLPEVAEIAPHLLREWRRLGVQDLPITSAHAYLAGSLDWSHRDPFDRYFAAQAISEDCVLVTKDAAFATLPGLATLW